MILIFLPFLYRNEIKRFNIQFRFDLIDIGIKHWISLLSSSMFEALIIILTLLPTQFAWCLSKNHFNITFYGDNNLWQYLEMLCNNIEEKKVTIILIENFNFSNENFEDKKLTNPVTYQRFVFNYLDEFSCPFEFMTRSTIDDIQFKVYELSHFNYQNLLLIFDFLPKYYRKLNAKSFQELMVSLNDIYLDCDNCLPLISLFRQSVQTLNKWIVNIEPMLNQRFQCSLISGIHSQKVIHFRPIVDGCLLYDGVYFPNKSSDYDRMKISYKKCNFNQTYVNVAINDVIQILFNLLYLINSIFSSMNHFVKLFTDRIVWSLVHR